MDWFASVEYATLLYKIVVLIVLVIVMNVSLSALKNGLRYFVKTLPLRYRIQEIANLCSGIVFLFFLIALFANDIKEFAIPFSVIGAGIAFSLQEIITSIAGRISIISSNLFQIGDRIQVGEIQGDVIHIGFLRTSLMEIGNWVKADQHTGRVIHVTNSTILKGNLINYSATFPFVWDEVVVPVRYGSDQHLARKIILDVTNKTTQDFQI
jgi:small-conductance mechanosensitive channel